jgi:hypothetical protein
VCMLALSRQTIFAGMALIVTLDSLLSVGVPPLSDVVALAVTKQGRAGYGSVRLWGSLGWAVAALLGGWLIERTGPFTMFTGYAISGFASTIGALVELPAMLWVDRLGRRHSPGRLLRISFLLCMAVALSVVVTPVVPVILLSHVIAGVAYSFFAVASVLFIGEVSPRGQVAPIMAIFTVTLPALIHMISGPVGGGVFDVRGAYALYVIGTIGAAVGWLIMKVMVKDRRAEE